jgi:GNAT superfamily N-acetyltransferase
VNIRSALEHDIASLDEIALEAKAHWRYSQAQMDAWRSELLTPPYSLRSCPTFLAEEDTEILGFARLDPGREPWQLAAMWIRPRFSRRGIGRALLRHVCGYAASFGQSVVAVDSDPNAKGFYLACGATVVGRVSAPISGDANRTRPQLVLSTMTVRGHR